MFYLTEITTKDGIFLEGMWFSPSHKASASAVRPTRPSFAKASAGKALLWVHGLTSTFYGNIPLMNVFVDLCEQEGYGFAAFNNRGHDLIATLAKVDKRKKKGYRHINGGAGYEDFKDSFYDIDAGVDFLKSQGFSEVIVIGHSTGALKACYYAAVTKNPNFFAVVLAAPASDRLDTSIDREKLNEDITVMEKLIKTDKGDGLLFGYHFFPITPKRFISLYKANSLEDQFDYGDKNPKLTHFKRIKKPTLVIFGEQDEYLDRPVEEVFETLKKYNKSKNFKTSIIANAIHSFTGYEQEFIDEVITWIKSL